MAPSTERAISATAGGSPGPKVLRREVCDERAQAGADESDSDEVREHQHRGAYEAAHDGGDHHPHCAALGSNRAGEHGAEDEPVNGEHEPEQAVPGEAGDHTAKDEHNRRRNAERGRKHRVEANDLRARPEIVVPLWTPMHPAWLRCSSLILPVCALLAPCHAGASTPRAAHLFPDGS